MVRSKRYKVFVSYSRHDEMLVRPLAGLVGATGEAVFLDVESLRPGDAWRAEIDSAVQQAAVFVLFWCCSSEASEAVGHEIFLAMQDDRKRLIPVRLCPMQLPASLGEWQWIDLQKRIVHHCDVTKDHARLSHSWKVDSAHLILPFEGYIMKWLGYLRSLHHLKRSLLVGLLTALISIGSVGPLGLGTATLTAAVITELGQWLYRLANATRVADEFERRNFADAFSTRAAEYFTSLGEMK